MTKPTIRIPLIPSTTIVENDDIMLLSKGTDVGSVEKTVSINNLKKAFRSINNLFCLLVSDEDELPKIELEAADDFISDFRLGDVIRFSLDFDIDPSYLNSLYVVIKKSNNTQTQDYLLIKKLTNDNDFINITFLQKNINYEFVLNEDDNFVLNSDEWNYKVIPNQTNTHLIVTTTLGQTPLLFDGFKINFVSPVTIIPASIVFNNNEERQVFSIEDILDQNPVVTKFISNQYYELVYINDTWYRTNITTQGNSVEYLVQSVSENYVDYTLTSQRNFGDYYDGMVINYKCKGSPIFAENTIAMTVKINELDVKFLKLKNKENIVCSNFERTDIITAVFDEEDDCFYANEPIIRDDVMYISDTDKNEGNYPKNIQWINQNSYKLLKEIPGNDLVIVNNDNQQNAEIMVEYDHLIKSNLYKNIVVNGSSIEGSVYVRTQEGNHLPEIAAIFFDQTFTLYLDTPDSDNVNLIINIDNVFVNELRTKIPSGYTVYNLHFVKDKRPFLINSLSYIIKNDLSQQNKDWLATRIWIYSIEGSYKDLFFINNTNVQIALHIQDWHIDSFTSSGNRYINKDLNIHISEYFSLVGCIFNGISNRPYYYESGSQRTMQQNIQPGFTRYNVNILGHSLWKNH